MDELRALINVISKNKIKGIEVIGDSSSSSSKYQELDDEKRLHRQQPVPLVPDQPYADSAEHQVYEEEVDGEFCAEAHCLIPYFSIRR